MVDPDVVRGRLREIDRRISFLEQIAARGKEAFSADPGLQAQAERHLHRAIQAAIDIALHRIAADDSPAPPEDYGSAFSVLASLGVVSDDLAERLRTAAGLRNILVHAYLEVDPEQIWSHLSNLGDLTEFASAAESYVSATGS